jgi:hypothetical protein
MATRDRNRTRLSGLSRLTPACAALGLSVALAALMAPPAARAGDDSSSEFYNATFGRLLQGFGFKSADDDANINYRERAPLVIPPTSNLPPPEKTSVVPNPAWPKDPDVARRKLIEKQEKTRNVEAERMREENPLPPDQLAPGPRPRGTPNADVEKSGRLGKILSPSELGYKGGLFNTMFHSSDDNDNIAKFTGEPPRAELTEPPPGYQTPSPSQPYGTGKAAAAKPDDYYAQHGELQR